MPFAEIEGFRCHYRLDGRDDRPALVLSHSLGTDLGLWDEQVAELAAHFLVVRYDHRGHGASSATPGDYTIEQLSHDAIALLDTLGLARVAFCGLSIGGMVGQWLAVNAPARIDRLVLANTSPRLADPAAMEARRRLVLEQGMAAVVDVAMARFFTPALLEANPPRVATTRRTLLSIDPVGYAGCCAALRDADFAHVLSRIAVPTLVIAGDADVPMPWHGHSEVLARTIPGAKAVRIEAAHLSNLGAPRAFLSALLGFLIGGGEGTYEAGVVVRRAVLGDAHVDRSLANATGFTREFQAFITRTAWGSVWTRPGLDWRTRRLLVLAITAARGNWEEFRLHVRSGLAADLEGCDLEEVLLTVAAYAGIPAANTAFHIASEEIAARTS